MRHKTLLLTLLMLFLMSLPALAVEPVLTVGTAVYGTGTMTVPITLATNGASLTSVAVNISYDPNVLSKPVGVIGAAATAASKALFNNVDATTGEPAAVNAEGTLTPSLGTYRILIAGDTGPNADTNTAVYPAADIAGARTLLADGEVATVTFTMSGTATSALTLTSTPFISDADGSALLVAKGLNRSSINLGQGWNMISLPLAPSQTAASVLFALLPVREVWEYKSGAWGKFDPKKTVNPLKNLAAGNGYWIYSNSATNLQIPGDLATKTVSLGTGWNMVGFNSIAAQDVVQAISSINSDIEKIWGYKDGGWLSYTPGKISPLKKFEPGGGYWIKMKQPVTWTLP